MAGARRGLRIGAPGGIVSSRSATAMLPTLSSLLRRRSSLPWLIVLLGIVGALAGCGGGGSSSSSVDVITPRRPPRQRPTPTPAAWSATRASRPSSPASPTPSMSTCHRATRARPRATRCSTRRTGSGSFVLRACWTSGKGRDPGQHRAGPRRPARHRLHLGGRLHLHALPQRGAGAADRGALPDLGHAQLCRHLVRRPAGRAAPGQGASGGALLQELPAV